MKKPCALALTLSLKCCRKSKAAASTGKAPAPVEGTGNTFPQNGSPQEYWKAQEPAPASHTGRGRGQLQRAWA